MKCVSVKRVHKRKTNKSRKSGKKGRKGGGIKEVAKETVTNVGETVGSALTGTTKIAAKTVKTGTDLAATGVETTGKVGSNVLEGVSEASGAVKNLTILEAIDFNKATVKASEVAAGSYKAPGQ